jgi:hypothetical protein
VWQTTQEEYKYSYSLAGVSSAPNSKNSTGLLTMNTLIVAVFHLAIKIYFAHVYLASERISS